MKYSPTIVFGVDQAATSGWGIAQVRGRVLEHGIAKDCHEREAVLKRVLGHVLGALEELLVVYEDHSGFWMGYGGNRTSDGQSKKPTRSAATPIGLGDARGRWFEQLELAGHPKMLRVGVKPSEWQPRVLGVAQRYGSELLKRESLAWASQHVGKRITDDNEADGICITAWGALDGIAVLEQGRKEDRQHARQVRAQGRQLAFTEVYQAPQYSQGRRR